MMKRTVVAFVVAALAVAYSAAAQENVTITLRSGERLAGQLMDMGAAGFAARINGQERQIPTNDVAVIDFTGAGSTQSDWDRLSSGHVIVLKNGEVLNGQLTDVGGSSPLRLSFNINGQNRDLTSNDVARIVMSRPADAPSSVATTGGASAIPGAATLTVSANQQWTPTGLNVRRGETLNLRATGEIKFGPASSSPAGSGEINQANPVPTVPTGALIGRIGNGQPFLIGNQTQIQAPAAGQLFLGVNDSHLPDNSGAFQVEIQRSGNRRR